MGDYRVCEPGEHRARAVSAALSINKTGFRYMDVVFDLQKGGQVTWTGWLGDDEKKNAWTIEALRNCGWQGDDLTDMRGIDKNMVMLKIEDNEYNGNFRSQVKFVNQIHHDDLHRNKLPIAEAKILAEKFKPLCQKVMSAKRRENVSRETSPGFARRPVQKPLPNPYEDGNSSVEDDDFKF